MAETKERNDADALDHVEPAQPDGPRQTDGEPPDEKEALRKKLEEVELIAASLKDQLLRKAAEFENYKRRSDADRIETIKYANERLFLSLLPVVDDFRRSLTSGADKKDFDAFFKGVDLILAKFLRILEGQGLVAFDSAGQPFNVEYHDALMQVPRQDVPPQMVVEEVEKGYKLNERVLRHAKVVVSTTATPETPKKPQDGEQTMSETD